MVLCNQALETEMTQLFITIAYAYKIWALKQQYYGSL